MIWNHESGTQKYRVFWNDLNPGQIIQVGELDGMPVVVTLFWAEIDCGLVCFWACDSMVADHRLVRAFLERTFPNVPSTDAMNFYNAIYTMRWARDHEPEDEIGVEEPEPPTLMRWASIRPAYPRRKTLVIHTWTT